MTANETDANKIGAGSVPSQAFYCRDAHLRCGGGGRLTHEHRLHRGRVVAVGERQHMAHLQTIYIQR